MLKKDLRAAEYRRLAGVEDALAGESLLENVREKHITAAARWTELALLDEAPSERPVWPPPAALRTKS